MAIPFRVLYKQFVNGVQGGLARHENLAAFPAAEERAAALRCLISNQIVLAQQIRPVRDDVAVPGAADRVLGHGELRRKAARDAVRIPASGSNVYQQTIDLFDLLQIGL